MLQTDPENADYALEGGATRNFEALRTAEQLAKKQEQDKEEEEKNNPMKVCFWMIKLLKSGGRVINYG